MNNYNVYDALKFTVAMGVIVWLYAGFILFNFVAAEKVRLLKRVTK